MTDEQSRTWTREMAVELAREEYERGLAEGRAEAAAEIVQAIETERDTEQDNNPWWQGMSDAADIARQFIRRMTT